MSPDKEFKNFCNTVEASIRKGKTHIRVHVVPKVFTPYLKFEINEAYIPLSKIGAKVFLIPHSEYARVLQNNFKPNDFWMFDERIVFELLYDKDGCFLDEKLIIEKEIIENYKILKNKITQLATPLEIWLKSSNF